MTSQLTTPQLTLDVIRSLPKVDLHNHVEGTVRAATVAELARKHGIPLPVEDVRDLYSYQNLEEFLQVLILVSSVFRDADDFRRMTYESILDSAATGVVHTEMFFTPHMPLSDGVPLPEVWAGLAEGIRQGTAETGTTARVIINFVKELGPAVAMQELELVLALPDPDGLIVGVGGDGVEAGVDDAALRPVFELAAARGLNRTYHAGEFSWQSVDIAINTLGCQRIDHGPLVVQDERLLAQAVELQVGFTVCPISDVEISKVYPSVADHPLPDMLAKGLLITLNSDDAALLKADVSDEYHAVLQHGLASPQQLAAIAVNGVTASWLPPEEKNVLMERVTTAWAPYAG